jgi:hypothetical protein
LGVVTLLVCGLLVRGLASRPVGAALIGLFVLYVASILFGLWRGLLSPRIVPGAASDEADESNEESAHGDTEEGQCEEMARRALPIHQTFILGGLGIISLGA